MVGTGRDKVVLNVTHLINDIYNCEIMEVEKNKSLNNRSHRFSSSLANTKCIGTFFLLSTISIFLYFMQTYTIFKITIKKTITLILKNKSNSSSDQFSSNDYLQ